MESPDIHPDTLGDDASALAKRREERLEDGQPDEDEFGSDSPDSDSADDDDDEEDLSSMFFTAKRCRSDMVKKCEEELEKHRRAREEGGAEFRVDDALVAAVGQALRDVDTFRPALNLLTPEQVRKHLQGLVAPKKGLGRGGGQGRKIGSRRYRADEVTAFKAQSKANMEAARRVREEAERANAAWVAGLQARFAEQKYSMRKYFGDHRRGPATTYQEEAVVRSHAATSSIYVEASTRLSEVDAVVPRNVDLEAFMNALAALVPILLPVTTTPPTQAPSTLAGGREMQGTWTGTVPVSRRSEGYANLMTGGTNVLQNLSNEGLEKRLERNKASQKRLEKQHSDISEAMRRRGLSVTPAARTRTRAPTSAPIRNMR